jgi:hypothetical protein
MTIELEEGLVTILAGVGVARPRLPQPPTFPAIRYQRIYTTRTNSVDGSNVGVTEVGIQIDCMDTTYTGAKALATSVREVLHGYSGTWGAVTSPETHLIARFVHLQTENDFYDQDGDDVTHWVSQRYQVWTNMD